MLRVACVPFIGNAFASMETHFTRTTEIKRMENLFSGDTGRVIHGSGLLKNQIIRELGLAGFGLLSCSLNLQELPYQKNGSCCT